MSPKGTMTSFLRTLGLSSTPNHTDSNALKPRNDGSGFSTARGADALFPRTTPSVDGEDCLHDCASCTISYPRKFSIDTEDPLYGEIKGWSRHLIVATGKTDWVRDVADEKDSVMHAVSKHNDLITGGRLMLSASNIPVPEIAGDSTVGPYGLDRPTRVLLLPSFTILEGVTPKLVPELLRGVVNTAPTNTTPLATAISATAAGAVNGSSPLATTSSEAEGKESAQPGAAEFEGISKGEAPLTLPAGLTQRPCPHRYLILLCSQGTRDARCGQSAPLLRRELERHLRPLGLYRDLDDDRPGGVGIYFISHVGGHKYSANMMIYRRGDGERERRARTTGGEGAGAGDGEKASEDAGAAQCIWLARVKPDECENIVKYTILQGKVVKPESQLRGGFDRARGVVSW